MTKPPYVPNPENSILLTLNDADAKRLAELVKLMGGPRLHVIRAAIQAALVIERRSAKLREAFEKGQSK